MICRPKIRFDLSAPLLTGALFCNLSFVATGGWAIEGDAPLEVPEVPFLYEGKKGLILPNKEIDLGEVIRGTSPEGELVLHNTAQTPIMIKEIKANCDCISLTTADDNSFIPGEFGKLLIKLNTQNVSFGNFVGTGYITTDEKLLPTTLITVRARVVEDILVFPPSLTFLGKEDFGKVKIVTVTSMPRDDTFKVERSEGGGAMFEVKVLEAKQGVHEISVTLKSLPEKLPHIEQINLFTNSTTTKKIPVVLRTQPPGGLLTHPFSADLGELAEGAHVTTKFTITGIPAGRSISIYPHVGVAGRYIDDPDQILKIAPLKSSGSESEAQIELLHTGVFYGTIHGKIVVVPDDPNLAETSFYFRAQFAKKK